jgi:hypothetical protein
MSTEVAYTVTFPCKGGSVTLSVAIDLITISDEDLRWTLDLINTMQARLTDITRNRHNGNNDACPCCGSVPGDSCGCTMESEYDGTHIVRWSCQTHNKKHPDRGHG